MGGVDPRENQALATAAGLGRVRAVVPLSGGANNRVFRVEAAAGVALLKSYFRHPDDPRDRLGAEWAFTSFAWDSGVRCIPRPLACDPAAGLALFEFVAGRSLHGTAPADAEIDAAIDFFGALNAARSNPAAGSLAVASEACFSIDDHLATVDRRVARLKVIPAGSAVDHAAAGFVEAELAPAWEKAKATARQCAADLGLKTDRRLGAADRCLSPSDFGFHNAIRTADGRLRFIDFEYAGWDDPAKLVCDFFCQPAVPAPPAAFDRFARAVAELFPEPDAHRACAAILLPVYRVKWCGILLNEFLPIGGRRRTFSTAADQDSRKAAQLAKARAALAALTYPDSSQRKVA
jgi:hypothetical protein